MKGFFDTSVLVSVFYGDHVHHKASLDLFIQFDKVDRLLRSAQPGRSVFHADPDAGQAPYQRRTGHAVHRQHTRTALDHRA